MLDTIRLNSQNDLVKVAKYLIGFSKMNEATDIYDKEFTNFVKDWQEKNILNSDGDIGKNSWTVLAQKALTCSTSKNKKSAYTCAVQILIGGLEVDGVYGPKTKQAVAAY